MDLACAASVAQLLQANGRAPAGLVWTAWLLNPLTLLPALARSTEFFTVLPLLVALLAALQGRPVIAACAFVLCCSHDVFMLPMGLPVVRLLLARGFSLGRVSACLLAAVAGVFACSSIAAAGSWHAITARHVAMFV